MIDCDRVFDVLTRGPFPTGAADDAEVELHLARCPECSRLAAALRPAIELFEEAVGPDEGRDLPSYWGEAAVDLPIPRVACAPKVDKAPAPRRRATFANYSHVVSDLTSATVWRVAALVALGMFIGSVVRSIAPLEAGGRPDSNAASSGPSGGGASGAGILGSNLAAEDSHHRLHMEPMLEFRPEDNRDVWVRVPLACVDYSAGRHGDRSHDRQPWIDRRLVDIEHCCTRCHNASLGASIPASATAYVQMSCRHCHFN